MCSPSSCCFVQPLARLRHHQCITVSRINGKRLIIASAPHCAGRGNCVQAFAGGHPFAIQLRGYEARTQSLVRLSSVLIHIHAVWHSNSR